jgi:S-formylglutathione hydrolase FrmB
LFVTIAALSCALNAQTVRRVAAVSGTDLRVVDGDGQQVQTLELNSKLLKRKVFFTVILPAEYFSPAGSGRVFPVLYLLHGLSGHFDNWTGKASLVKHLAGTNAIAVTPEGADGWYTDSATKDDDKFESYIVEELIPDVDHRYRTIREGRGRGIAGLSMGGYGAIKFGLKYPDMFSLAGSFSGALDAPLRTEKSAFLRPSITSVFGADDSKTRAENDIFSLIRNASQEKIKSLPFIYLDCGTEDPFLPTNRDFDALLVEKKVPHEFRELPGKHDWEYWDQQVKEFFLVAARQKGFLLSAK